MEEVCVHGNVTDSKVQPTSSIGVSPEKPFTKAHRAMFKLGGKKLFVLCLLVKNVSAVYSADRCDFSMLNSSCYWISSGPHGS